MAIFAGNISGSSLTGSLSYTSLTSVPTGIVSSSTQIAASIPTGTVSSSGQVDYNSITNKLSGVVSSSTQVAPLLPGGTVSASGQVLLNTLTGTTFSNNAFYFPTDLRVEGNLTVQQINTEYVSSSVIYESGSTKFGDTTDDVMSVTGSIRVLGGSISGSMVGALTGNASTATALATARAINGTNFDGTAAITVTAAAGTLTGATLASGVTASSLTSVGTLGSLTVTNPITGSVTGNASTVTNATFYRQFTVRDDRSDGNDYSLAARPTGLYAITGTGTNGPGSSYLSLIHVANSTDVAFQIAGGYTSDNMYFRGTSALQSGTGYGTWRTVIHSGNIGSQTVSSAGTATALATARAINGTNFDGTAAITVTAAAGTLTGATLASGVTASSLTSVGTLTSLAVSGAATVGTTLGVTGAVTANGGFLTKGLYSGNSLAILGDGAASQYNDILINGAATANFGFNIVFQSNGSSIGQLARVGRVDGGTSDAIYLRTTTAAALNLGANSTTVIGLLAGAATVTGTLGVTGVTTIAAGTAALPALTTTGDTNTGFLFPAADTIALSTGGTERARIDTSGNLGVGTASPSERLTVISAANTTQIRFTDNTNCNGYLGSRTGNLATLHTDQILAFGTGNSTFTERARIDASGNLGVGTSSPTSTLHVVGTATISSTLAVTGTATFSGTCKFATSGGDMGFIAGTGDGATFATYNTALSGHNGLAFYNPTVGGAYPNAVSGVLDFRNGVINMKGGFQVNGTSVAVNGAAASFSTLGIGTATPSASLHVSGTTMVDQIIEKVTVTASAAPATLNYNILDQAILFHSASSTANWTLNFRGNTTTPLNSMMYNGQSITATVLVLNGATAYSASAYQIDGASIIPRWQGGASGSANASSLDAHQFTIIKVASASYVMLGSITKYT
jgi:hypothetical protein